jgi:hypothetical protein
VVDAEIFTYPTDRILVDEDGRMIYWPLQHDTVIVGPPRLDGKRVTLDVRHEDGKEETLDFKIVETE